MQQAGGMMMSGFRRSVLFTGMMFQIGMGMDNNGTVTKDMDMSKNGSVDI